jgi:acetylglutamate kinase
MNSGPIVIKIGGVLAQDDKILESLAAEVRSGVLAQDDKILESLAAEVRSLADPASARNRPVAIVHGGGTDVSSLSKQLGIEPSFADGIRMTSEAEMDVVDMVLCGLVNKRLVRAFTSAGLPAVGVSGADGALLTGEPVADARGNRSKTAHVQKVRPGLLEDLWAAGYLPVVASPGVDGSGGAVNINADEAAFAVGGAVKADAIVFLSDVRGVQDSDCQVIGSLSTGEATSLIEHGVATGGMVAKLRSAAGAIVAGVDHIVVGTYEQSGDLLELLAGRAGTTIHGE